MLHFVLSVGLAFGSRSLRQGRQDKKPRAPEVPFALTLPFFDQLKFRWNFSNRGNFRD